MKNRAFNLLAALAMLLIPTLHPSSAFAQGTAFTYQGQLENNGNLASGTYNLQFTLYTNSTGGASVAGPVTNNAVAITNGLFTVIINFGSSAWNGETNWLQIGVESNNATSFTPLSPRQELTPVPYAIFAETASNLSGTLPVAQLSGAIPTTNLTGMVSLAQLPAVVLTNNATGITLSGTFNGSGAGLTGVPGSFSWVNVTGTNQQAQSNTGYVANNASNVFITLPAAPNVGDIVRVSGAGTGGWIIGQNAGQAIQAAEFGAKAGTNWNFQAPWTQTSAPTNYWRSIASSADGTNLAAAAYIGGIYTSTNAGLTWIQTSAPNTNWVCIASSSDGTILAAVFYGNGNYNGGGEIYVSTNAGATWNPAMAPNTNWYSIASSSDGTHLAAAAYGGGIWTSTNTGGTWNPTTEPPYAWESIASSADGNKLAAVVYEGGIYTSTNAGGTWTQTGASGTGFWISIVSSANGTNLTAGINAGGIDTSTYPFSTWLGRPGPLPNGIWNEIASSADGSVLAAGSQGNGIYVSTNFSGPWVESSAPTNTWVPIASSADGNHLVAGDYGGGIYTLSYWETIYNATTTPGPAGYLSGGQNSAIELQYIGNGLFMTISHEGTISEH